MTDFPMMKGDARVARGASYFEVPLFSHVIDNLWQGCSPADFPDVLVKYGYDVNDTRAYNDRDVINFVMQRKPANCKWLMEHDPILLRDRPRFDSILNLYQWGEYVVPEGTERVTVTMYDSVDEVSDQVDELASLVIKWLSDGKKVLVHCQAGLNRSSLIVARVLMLKYDMTADEAIDHVRASRSPMCLCNDTFRQFLKGLL